MRDLTERLRSSSLLRRVSDPLVVLGRMLFCRIPLSSPPGQLSCNPFFIVGSGRSGNTLLRAMLVQHPDVSIPPESKVLPRVIRNFHRYSFLPWPDLARLVILEFENARPSVTWQVDFADFCQRILALEKAKRSLAVLLDRLYMYHAERKHPGATRWGDKTPINTFHIEKLNWVFPQTQFVHIIRDGRDVVSSYLEFGMHPTVEFAAARWITSIARAQRASRRLGAERYYEIRYEQLVLTPEQTLQGVCSFLGLGYLPALLDFWRNTGQLGDAEVPHHANLKNRVNADSIGRWRQRLSAGQQAKVRELLGPKLRELGYSDV